jgi:hypothetical protein
MHAAAGSRRRIMHVVHLISRMHHAMTHQLMHPPLVCLDLDELMHVVHLKFGFARPGAEAIMHELLRDSFHQFASSNRPSISIRFF